MKLINEEKKSSHKKIWIGRFIKIFLALSLFIIEVLLLIGPNGWLREEKANYLIGEGSWTLGLTNESGQAVCQVFVPQYRNLDSIGIVITSESELSEGNASFIISDKDGEILFDKEVPYAELEFGYYMDIPVNLVLSRNKEYDLSIWLEKSSNGIQPLLEVCGKEMYMYENKELICDEEIENTQLLIRYIYSKAISTRKILIVFTLSMITALLLVIKLPNDRRIKYIGGIILLLLIPFVLGRRLELLNGNIALLLPQALIWNIGIMYIFEFILLLCTQSFSISIVMSDVLLTVLYSANYFVYKYRGTALKINELKAMKTAAQVIGQYNFTPNSHLAMVWCIAIFFAVAGWKLNGIRKKNLRYTLLCRTISCVGGIVLAIGSIHLLIDTDFLESNGFDNFQGWSKEETYYNDGYLVGSFIDIKNNRNILMESPYGYSRQAARELLETYQNAEEKLCPEEFPHIILIMNESFSDLRVLGNLEISEENLNFFYGLQENTIRGNVNASVLGGGTPNSEFEVLTGCTMGFLPTSYYPYQECMFKPIDSLVSILNDYDYMTYSIHPHLKGNWNRANVYANLGFDKSLWRDDFENAEMIHYGISDAETYRKIEELFENRLDGEKMFIFDVTLQNHGGYTYEDNCVYHVDSVNVLSSEADSYLSLIKESDVAFHQLISYFSQEDEKVVICMFGDHQPKFSDDTFYESLYGLTENLTGEDILFNQYKTPFLIWANYDIQEEDKIDISMNYLGAFLLDAIGIEGSSYFNFLIDLKEDYPIITINGYQDKEGNIYEWSGTKEEFLEYRLLQYYFLFD